MHQFALEVVQAWNVWPTPLIQDTSSIDQNIAGLFDCIATDKVSTLYNPFPRFIFPLCTVYLALSLAIPFQPILRLEVLKVASNLWP